MGGRKFRAKKEDRIEKRRVILVLVVVVVESKDEKNQGRVQRRRQRSCRVRTTKTYLVWIPFSTIYMLYVIKFYIRIPSFHWNILWDL